MSLNQAQLHPGLDRGRLHPVCKSGSRTPIFFSQTLSRPLGVLGRKALPPAVWKNVSASMLLSRLYFTYRV